MSIVLNRYKYGFIYMSYLRIWTNKFYLDLPFRYPNATTSLRKTVGKMRSQGDHREEDCCHMEMENVLKKAEARSPKEAEQPLRYQLILTKKDNFIHPNSLTMRGGNSIYLRQYHFSSQFGIGTKL